MRNHTMTVHSTVYRGEGDTETEIEVEVCGTIVPYFAGTFHDPPDGGFAEDVRAFFYDGSFCHEIELTDSEVEQFSDKLMEADADYEADAEEPDDDYDLDEDDSLVDDSE